jgi:hypothetical protein
MYTARPTTISDQPQQVVVPRLPEPSEKSELLSCPRCSSDTSQFGIDEEERANARALIDSAYIAVYDTYASDSKSGYAGKIMSIVWPTDPNEHDVFVWRNGHIESVQLRQDDRCW